MPEPRREELQPASSRLQVVSSNTLLPRRSITEREKYVLTLLCEGLSNAEMALRLGNSRETVKSELKRIFRKIEVTNRTQAAVLFTKRGMA